MTDQPSILPPRRIRNLALVGFMGTGKSTIGQLAAQILSFNFFDTDQMIEERSGKPINAIFSEQGEAVFRSYEQQVIKELASCDHCVISTGGGVLTNPENLSSLKSHSLLVCLWASPETIYNRVKHQTHRPLLQGADPMAKISELLAARRPLYIQSDVLVGSDFRSPREVAAHVVHEFRASLSRSV
ncbi:MAG: shikimate kinase [Verrucomicrobiota bacterium]|nr:shikimate kinase [Verrucomicrobiota bacterium]